MKVWLDFCEPKSVTMLKPLYEKLIKSHEVLITARDFDSTYYLLDKWGVKYTPLGKYGGRTLVGKLEAYTDRLGELIKIIKKFEPEFLFCITAPEAMRISFGLQIPNIMFNDEPRSYGPCTTTFPYVNQLIVPHCIPLAWYLEYGLKQEKIIRFNGIDEVGWLSEFKPDERIIKGLSLEKEAYTVCRTEPTKAGYLTNKMEPHETQLTEIIPELLSKKSDLKHIILTRNEEQFTYLNKFFKNEIKNEMLQIFRGLDNLAHVMYFSKMVLTGGGTMVRESALLGIPSIEFFPLDTYPQEQFLIDNGFPLVHAKKKKAIVQKALEYIEGEYKINTTGKIKELENPIDIGLREFNKRISKKN